MANYRLGKWDTVILGAFLGLLIGYPQMATWIRDFVISIVPDTWLVFGAYSVVIYLIVIGAIIGYITGRTR